MASAVVLMLIVLAITGQQAGKGRAQDDLRLLRATAIRNAAEHVAKSIVRVEKFGVMEAGGEVADDAPTVAVAIDDQNHYIASMLVKRQTPTSLVLVAEDGTRSTAKVIATDHKRQLVLLEAAEKLAAEPVELAEVPTSIGQTVVAVGRIAGDGSIAVSKGVLSAEERLWGIALQTDARVSSVYYGGPLVDLYGRVLGILVPAVPDEMGEDVTAWYDAGVAFAIPAASIAERLPTLLQGKDIRDGLAGIVAKSNDPYQNSTEVAAVRPRSPAARADLRAEDKILRVNEVPVASHREIKQVLGSFDAGQTVTFEFQRNDQTLKKTLTLAESIPPLQPQWLGMVASETSPPNDGAAADVKRRVSISGIFPGSPAASRLQVGDVIIAVDEIAIENIQALRQRVFSADPDQPLTLQIERGDGAAAVKQDIELTTVAVAGSLPTELAPGLESPPEADAKWAVKELNLPDIANKSALAAPADNAEATPAGTARGLLVLLTDSATESVTPLVTEYLDLAKRRQVVVCVMAPAKESGWSPEEIDNVARVVASVSKQHAVDPLMTVISGLGSGPGGSMAIAVALGRPGVVAGLAVLPQTTPPAMRLRENDAAAPLQVLLRALETEEMPPWVGAFDKAGYAVIRADEQRETMLKWIRSVPRI